MHRFCASAIFVVTGDKRNYDLQCNVYWTDYLLILDIHTAELLEYEPQPLYSDIAVTPLGDILLTDGYDIDVFYYGRKRTEFSKIVLPVTAACEVRFGEYGDHFLGMTCYDYDASGEPINLKLDWTTLEWL